MRKLMVLPLAGLLALGVVGPVAAAPNVSNTSGGGESIYGEWSAEGTYGYVSVGEDSQYGGYADIYQESGTWVECDPGAVEPGKDTASTQDTTPGDGDYGFVGTRTWGYGEGLTVDLSRRLDSGHATGSIELYTATVDECAGDYGDEAVSEVATLDVSVTATGPLVTLPRPRQLQAPVRVQRAPELPRQGACGERDGLGRLLDRRHVQLRGHERVHLVGPQQQLSPLAVRSPKPRAPRPGLRHAPSNRNRVMSSGKTDQANAFTGRSSHRPPCVQWSALAS